MTRFCATFFRRVHTLKPQHEKYASLAERNSKIRQAAGTGNWLRIEARDVTEIYRLHPACRGVTSYDRLFDFELTALESSYDEPAPCAATNYQLGIHFGPVVPRGLSARVLCPSHTERMKLVNFLLEHASTLTLSGRELKICGLALVDTTVAYESRPHHIGRRQHEERFDRLVQDTLKRLIAERVDTTIPVLA